MARTSTKVKRMSRMLVKKVPGLAYQTALGIVKAREADDVVTARALAEVIVAEQARMDAKAAAGEGDDDGDD